MRILIIEDSETWRFLLLSGLVGHDVEVAEDAAQAMQKIRHRNRFDLVISDYDLPGPADNEFILLLQKFGYLTVVLTGLDPKRVGDCGDAKVFYKSDVNELFRFVQGMSSAVQTTGE